MTVESSGGNYDLGRLVLDYIKPFLWPVVALAVIGIYQDDVRTILSEREVDIFGLRLGEKVEQIQSRALAEIEDIRLLLEAPNPAAGGRLPHARKQGSPSDGERGMQ